MRQQLLRRASVKPTQRFRLQKVLKTKVNQLGLNHHGAALVTLPAPLGHCEALAWAAELNVLCFRVGRITLGHGQIQQRRKLDKWAEVGVISSDIKWVDHKDLVEYCGKVENLDSGLGEMMSCLLMSARSAAVRLSPDTEKKQGSVDICLISHLGG